MLLWQEEDLAGVTCDSCECYFVSSPGSNINIEDKNLLAECPKCATLDKELNWSKIKHKKKKEK